MTYLEKVLALTAETPEASTVPKPIGSPTGPGLWHHKHWMLPPYIQHVAHALMRHGHGESDAIHMAVGIVKHWAEGHDGHGHKTHPDVRAAAAANVAKWEELRAHAHAATAAKHAEDHRSKGDHELAASYSVISQCLVELTNDTIRLAFPNQPGPPQSSFLKHGTAPGARPLSGRLFHVPSQTVAAGPPLPPGATLPTPAELDALAAEIQSTLPRSDLVRGAVAHAHAAATKMRANQPVDALHMLKSCQIGIVSAHREYNASQIPVANVFTASLNPAEQSSAQAAMYEGLDTREKFRRLTTQCAILRDRIRRHYFHGMYNHMAEARF